MSSARKNVSSAGFHILNMDTTRRLSFIILSLQIFLLLPQKCICVQHPVKITSVQTSVYPDGTKNLTLTYTSIEAVRVFWMVDIGTNKGFGLKHIEPLADITNTYNNNTGISTVILPSSNTTFDTMSIHIACTHNLYEVHMDMMSPSLWTNQILEVKPYSFYAPPSKEIGITPQGMSQFHIDVNTSGSSFDFGLLIGNLYTMIKNAPVPYIHEETTYSFLPTAAAGSLRIVNQIQNASNYNADMSVDLPQVAQNGGVVSILAVGKGKDSLIKRMYIRRTVHFMATGKNVAIPMNTVAIVNRNSPSTVSVMPGQPFIIRCLAMGNPIPSVELYKRTTAGDILVTDLPALEMSFPYQTSKLYSLLNVNSTLAGIYVCKAKSGTGDVEKTTMVNLAI